MYKNTLCVAALVLGAAANAVALAQATDSGSSAQAPSIVETIQVTTQRLDAARNSLSPETGSSIYRIDSKDIEALPLGTSTPLNDVILHAPGVVQDSFGQLHVRGDHANLQYRINGVVIPEPIAGFGQAFDSRFADSINLLTGALPAQYGYRTAGIVDLHTKSGAMKPGGSIGYLGGSYDHHEGTADLRGSRDGFSYYLTGSYLTDDLGIENPTPDTHAIHDHTKQQKGFAYLSYVLDPTSRLSAILGSSDGKFEIPNSPGVDPTYTLAGTPPVASENLNARQDEKNQFQVLSYQKSAGNVDYQLSIFHRYSDIHYQPDPVGDLIYNGVAAQILRKDEASGLQGDLAWHLGDTHTVRSGVYYQHERFGVDNASTVFPADENGNQRSDVPFTIVDNSHITGSLVGAYLQDEWTPTDPLTVNYGIRYDHVDTVTNEMQWSPRIGVTYDLSHETRVHAGYARYFTPPPTEKIDTTSVQAFLGTSNALPSDANTAVKSERSNYYDIGISHQLTRDVTVGADAYYRDVRHLQDEGQFGNALIFSAFNYEKGRIYGLELSGTYRRGPVSAYANVGISRAEGRGIETGQFNFDPAELAYIQDNWVHLDHDQTVAASAGAAYQFGGATLSADLLYGSGLRRGFANSEHLPSYTTVNLGLLHPATLPMVGKLDFRVAVVNLFDRVYELRDGSGIGVGAPQWGQRRSLYVGVGKSFG